MKRVILSSLLLLSSHRLLAEWRLSGLINMPEYKQAIFEAADKSTALILSEGQKSWDIEVIKIDSKNQTVEVTKNMAHATMRLSTDFRIGQTATPPTLMLDHASSDAVLDLYSDFANRTLLLHPLLSKTDITINSQASNFDAAAQVIEKVLTEKGMAFIPDGDVFRMVVPQQMATTIKAESLKIKVPEPKTPCDITYNFPNIPFMQAADIYAGLFGCHLDFNEHFPPEANKTIKLLTETKLNKDESIYALGTLFAWSGLKMIPSGQNLMKAVPLDQHGK